MDTEANVRNKVCRMPRGGLYLVTCTWWPVFGHVVASIWSRSGQRSCSPRWMSRTGRSPRPPPSAAPLAPLCAELCSCLRSEPSPRICLPARPWVGLAFG